jgi:uncharacterized protein YhjY with autotransporter beta-barrel domain
MLLFLQFILRRGACGISSFPRLGLRIALALFASAFAMGGVAYAQCVPTFVATPLNVQQTYTFAMDGSNSANFSVTACDPDTQGVYDTSADALGSPEQAEEGPIPNGQITGTIHGQFFVGGTGASEYIQYTPTSNPGVAYSNTVTYYTWDGVNANPQSFTVNIAAPVPTVSSLSASSGSGAGGASITISGTGFTGATGVTLGGTAATSFSVVNDGSITVVTPAHAAGTIDVTVTAAGGTSAAVTADHYTFIVSNPTLTASSTTPSTVDGTTYTTGSPAFSVAPSGGSGSYTSYALNFVSSATVASLGLSFDTTSGKITGTPTTTGFAVFTVTVTDSASNTGTTAQVTLTVNAGVPTAPSIGLATAGNAQASIAFGPPTSANGAFISGYTMTSTPGGFTGSGGSSPIIVTGLANGTAYTFSVTARNSVGTGAASSASNSVTPLGPPTISGISPSSGTSSGGTNVTITGTNLTGATAVSFGATGGTIATPSANGTTMVVTTPAHAAGTVDVTVTGPGGTSAAAIADQFTFMAPNPTATQAIASKTLTQGNSGAAFTPVTGGGGTTPLAYSVSPTLPAGLTLSPTTGAITGSPSVTSTATTYTVTVTDANSLTAMATFSLTVNGAVVATQAVASTSLTQNHLATSFTPVTGSGGTGTLSYSVSPTLPAGLSLSPTTGQVSGNPTATSAATTYTVTVTDANSATNSATFSLTVSGAVTATQLISSTSLTVNHLATSFTPVTGGSGTTPLAYSVSPTLPAGLGLSPTTGQISGTPTATRTATTYTVTVTDANSATATNTFSLTVNSTVAATQAVASAILTQNHLATSFTPVTGSGGTSPLAYSVSPTLPAGLSLSPTTGQVSGNPTATSTATTYTVTVTDANSVTATASFSLTVNGAVVATQAVASTSLTQNHLATSFTPVTGSGGTSPLAYSVSPTLPAGLGLSPTTGQVSGTPTASSTATTYTVTVTDANSATATASFSLTVNGAVVATQAVASTILTQNRAATSFTPVTGSGGTSPLAYSVSPTLPAGLSLSPTTGQVSGNPSATSTATTYTVTVTDANSTTATATFSLTVNGAVTATQAVASTVLTQGHLATSFTPVTGSGGTGALSYSVSPSLPAGLSLASGTGVLTGTPTAANSATTYTVTVTDTNGATATASFGLTVNGAPVATQAVASTALTQNRAAASFTPVTGTGGTGSLTYSVSPALPSGLSLASGTGAITGTPSAASAATSYTVTVTDTNSATATANFSLRVNGTVAATQAVASAILTQNHTATSFTPVTGSGGTSPLAYSVSPTLPAGLSLAPTTGQVSGNPTATSTATTYTVTVTDANSATATASFSLTVNGAVVATQAVASTSLTQNHLATSFTPVTGSGGTSPLAYSVSPTLPAGLGLSPTTGQVSGTPTASSTATTYTVTVTDANSATATASFSLTVNGAVVATQAVASTILTQNRAATSFTPVTGSGGTSPLAYSVSPTLPAGLSLSPTTGQVSGNPSATSTATTYTVTVTDANSTTATATFSLTVNGAVTATQAVASTVLTQGHLATSFTPVTGSGGTGALSYSVSPSLPAGLSLASGTGVLTGTPTAANSATTYTVTVTDTNGATATASFGLTVNGAPVATQAVASTALTQNRAAASFTPVTGTGGTGSLTYSVSPALPSGLSLALGTGAITGTPSAASAATSYTVTVTDTNSATATANFSLRVNGAVVATQAVASTVLTQGHLATSFTPVTGSGGTSPLAYSVSPGLPPGLSLASGTGAITGTPTVITTATNYTVTVTDTNSATATATFSLTVNPQVPTAGAVSQTVTGNTSGNNIPLNLGGGTATSVAIASAASHGTATASGTTITYAPTHGYAGPDSFTYTATNNISGTSAPGTVSITVTAPTLAISPSSLPAGSIETAYSQTLTGSGGIAPYGFALVSGTLPAGVTLSTVGVLAGTPTAGGSFPVTIKATDSTGFTVSQVYTLAINAATVTLTPATLPAPQVNVAYSQTLSASGGVAPYHFTVSGGQLPPGLTLNATTGVLSGTPSQAASYNATIQVTDSSTGSGPYHASINYQLPTIQQVPVAAAVTATTPANIRAAINVGASVTGPINSVAVATNPTHGTAVPSGVNIVYTPTTNYFGTDSFTYTATGPGGTSAPATVTVTVTPLAVPAVQPLTAQVLANTPVTLNATASTANGPFTAVAIASPPSAGTAVVSGQNIVYTPAANQAVTANITFTYTVANSFGVSAPGTVTITVNPVPLPPPPQTVVAPPSSPTSSSTVTASITDGAQGGPFVSASLVNVSPPNAGTITLVPIDTQTGSIAPMHLFAEAFGIKPAAAATLTVAGHAFNVVFVPNPSFVGTVTVTYTLANAFAASVQGEVLFVVQPRPDVSADADVVGLVAAQVEEARRFATAQIGNFNQRLEQLHGDGPAHSSNGLSVNFGDRMTSAASTDPDEDPTTRGTADIHRLNRNDARNPNADPLQDPKARHDGGGDDGGESILPKNLAFWTGGSVDFGSRSSTTERTGFNFTTDGVSGGADYRIDNHFTVGIGGGYGHDQSDIGTDGTKSVADSYNIAIYGSYHPSTETFIDAVLGYGWLSYDSTRLIATTTDYARGHRDGEQSFGSLTAGYEYKTDTFRLTPYGRFDYSDSTLDQFSELALGHAALTYFSQSVTTTTATLGLKGDLAVPLEWAMFLPFLRIELQHDLQGATRAGLAYADLASAGPAYFVPGDPVDRNHMQLGIGANLKVGTFTFGVAFENSFGVHEEQDSQLRLLVSSHF